MNLYCNHQQNGFRQERERESVIGSIDNTQFTVFDVETTGLFPQVHDRIIEIAAIRVDGSGTPLDEYATLVNPNRDLGPTDIHGITAKEVKGAPSFEEIAGDVMSKLAGAVFVGHNVLFDFQFIQAEVMRLGHTLPQTPLLCTMKLAKRVDPAVPRRKLGACCSHFGVSREHAHSAYHDASATARLLSVCLRKAKEQGAVSLGDIGVSKAPVGKDYFPQFPESGRSLSRKKAQELIKAEVSYIAQLVASLPANTGTRAELDDYFALLDRVLEDRRVTPGETDALFELAENLGISREQAVRAHDQYMRDLIHAALADDMITKHEQEDLEGVRRLLSISGNKFEELFSEVRKERETESIAKPLTGSLQDEIEGKTICFTGSLRCQIKGAKASRALAQKLAEEKGMIVKKGVTKVLGFLVAADPDSMSGKAKKASEYGVRIIAEPVFWRMMGVEIE
jgi:DNA polymerase-3 subunit epsilon